ncbi:hypothetical protein TIFTF001_007042 [Ficus carica]|uniref:Uncharacterized protein n=1 Tax=Ficus carica TaxID=3494 RepID=A0AA87ZP63_FICCA|nr:hypothetical protein TIFTF001_007042 [Ficus carica]
MGNLRAVSGVDFNGYGFLGKGGKLKLEGFLNELPDLAFFHSNSNNFTESVPDVNFITKIRFLYELDLSNNKLTGPFPKQVLQAKNLTFLDLRFNNYAGPIPADVFKLDVQVIFLNNNNFEQNIPDSIDKTPALYLTFANNKFTGPIPRSIGFGNTSNNLLEVLFLNNKLSGCLPYEIGQLKKITLFDASKNLITGPIPQSFACLNKIEILNFANNLLYGDVPELVCKLPNLQSLTLSSNYITEVGPECRKLIKKGRLDVRNNCILDLPNQRSKEVCADFFKKNPRDCLQNKWMFYLPCRKQFVYDTQANQLSDGRQLFDSSDDDDDDEPDSTRRSSSSRPVSYAALTPNGL